MADRRIYSGDDIDSGFLKWRIEVHRSSSYQTGSNLHGDVSGSNNPYTMFNVTGDVLVKNIYGVVNVSITDATGPVDIEVGVTGNTAELILAITDSTTLLDGHIYGFSTTSVGAGPNQAGSNVKITIRIAIV